VKVVTICSGLILAVLRPREGGLRRGENFWLRLTAASAQCLRLSERFIFIELSLKIVTTANCKAFLTFCK